MVRFDVYRHPDAKQRKALPFFISIQSDTLDFLRSTIVVPLVAERVFGPRIEFLHPVLDVNDHFVVLATNELVAVEKKLLGSAVANLAVDASTIVSAVDYLTSGY